MSINSIGGIKNIRAQIPIRLQALVEKGWVDTKTINGKVCYTITQKGEREFKKQKALRK